MPFGHDFCRPISIDSPVWSNMPMMMTYLSADISHGKAGLTGSVRGYAKLCNPFVEKHGTSASGFSMAVVQLLFHPPQSEYVRDPQAAQNYYQHISTSNLSRLTKFRQFQSIKARAWAKIPASHPLILLALALASPNSAPSTTQSSFPASIAK